jgi:uncharacterized RDD family membrane protein YckC
MGKRVVAFAADLIIVVILFCSLIMIINWGFNIPVENSFFDEGRGITIRMNDYAKENLIFLVMIYSLAKVIVVLPYFVLFESGRRQATPGKRMMGIRVAGIDGERISISRALFRVFGKWVSGQLLGIGYLIAFFTNGNRALHDLIAGTRVLENRAETR